MANSSPIVLVLLAATALTLLLIGFVVFIVVLYKKRLLLEQFETEKLKTGYQKQLLKQSIEVQDRERERIGKNLHDEIGINLTAARNLVAGIQPSETSQEQLTYVRDLLKDTSEQVRSLSRGLFPGTLKNLGLAEALQELCDKAKASGVLCNFSSPPSLPKLTITQESSLFYIASEVLNNSLKHAEATEITARLSMQDERLVLQVQDNGKGFDSQAALRQSGSLGMKSISGRANALNASYTFAPGPERGTRFSISVPLLSEAEELPVSVAPEKTAVP